MAGEGRRDSGDIRDMEGAGVYVDAQGQLHSFEFSGIQIYEGLEPSYPLALWIIREFGSWLHHAEDHAIDSCGCIPPGHQNGCEVTTLLRIGEAWSAICQGKEPPI